MKNPIRKITLFLLFLTAFTLPAENSKAVLRIGDATRNGDHSLRHAALLFSLHNNVEITINRVAAATALKKLEAGDFSFIVADAADIPENRPFPSEDHGWEVLAVYMHPANPCRNLSLAQLNQIIRKPRINWFSINGDRAAIHRFTTSEQANNPGLMKKMFPSPAISAFTKLGSTEEVLLMVADDPVAIGIAPWTISIPANVATAKVENITPTLSAIRKNRYPLSIHYLRVKAQKLSPQAEKFIEFLYSVEFDRILLDNGLVPPFPRHKSTVQ